MIPLQEAQQYVRETLHALAPVQTPLSKALGCVAAEQLIALEPVPGFTNSSMDGYALRAADTSGGAVRLRVVGIVLAGDVPTRPLTNGEVVRIMTGAPLPDGADAVCMIEETSDDATAKTVLITRTVSAGEFVRRPGEDIGVGQVLVEAGTELNAALVGVLASQGFASVPVHPRPRVGVLSTGNELVGPDESLAPGKIRDVNRPMLLALVRQSGFTPVDLGIIGDDQSAISARLETGVGECDAVVSTGGVSVGDVDHVKTVLAEICEGRARWMQVAIRPGKPFAFGVAGPGARPIFGLAGNPVSTRVGFELFVRPALRRLAGHHTLERPTINMVLDVALPRQRDGKLHLIHVISRLHDDGRVHIEGVARHGSHLLSAVAHANALAMVPDGNGFASGDVVPALLLELETLQGNGAD